MKFLPPVLLPPVLHQYTLNKTKSIPVFNLFLIVPTAVLHSVQINSLPTSLEFRMEELALTIKFGVLFLLNSWAFHTDLSVHDHFKRTQ